ncbi:uncharacterized protein Tco025E_02694 [Trypanosoma conorhini]|uniref:Uncharacterized protein n=1 Tax=Trypanosoma conorhini TaxID=83891 RepID=A0A422Q1U1_9TRYP|nr:uncharacterized protein Tco025E_02694 [Trypanosoma conorhini]RNF23936.1 hypothetical protein Tco025E_02694 [Trypanosoma conorhini]
MQHAHAGAAAWQQFPHSNSNGSSGGERPHHPTQYQAMPPPWLLGPMVPYRPQGGGRSMKNPTHRQWYLDSLKTIQRVHSPEWRKLHFLDSTGGHTEVVKVNCAGPAEGRNPRGESAEVRRYARVNRNDRGTEQRAARASEAAVGAEEQDTAEEDGGEDTRGLNTTSQNSSTVDVLASSYYPRAGNAGKEGLEDAQASVKPRRGYRPSLAPRNILLELSDSDEDYPRETTATSPTQNSGEGSSKDGSTDGTSSGEYEGENAGRRKSNNSSVAGSFANYGASMAGQPRGHYRVRFGGSLFDPSDATSFSLATPGLRPGSSATNFGQSMLRGQDSIARLPGLSRTRMGEDAMRLRSIVRPVSLDEDDSDELYRSASASASIRPRGQGEYGGKAPVLRAIRAGIKKARESIPEYVKSGWECFSRRGDKGTPGLISSASQLAEGSEGRGGRKTDSARARRYHRNEASTPQSLSEKSSDAAESDTSTSQGLGSQERQRLKSRTASQLTVQDGKTRSFYDQLTQLPKFLRRYKLWPSGKHRERERGTSDSSQQSLSRQSTREDDGKDITGIMPRIMDLEYPIIQEQVNEVMPAKSTEQPQLNGKNRKPFTPPQTRLSVEHTRETNKSRPEGFGEVPRVPLLPSVTQKSYRRPIEYRLSEDRSNSDISMYYQF